MGINVDFFKGLLFYFLFAITFSCNIENIEKETISQPVLTKYAKGFEIEQKEGYKVIKLKKTWKGGDTSLCYVLYKNQRPRGYKDAIFIKTPIKSIACMSITHISFIEKLGKENTIRALSGCNYVSSEKLKQLIKDKKIKEIGEEQTINYELLVNESVDIVMAYGINQQSTKYIDKMKELGQTVVLNAEYMETHPLGKLEWIKFIAAFYELDNEAIKIFNEVEEAYLELANLMDTVSHKPIIFTGMPWKGSWNVAGAKSYQVQLFDDAGAKYLWLDNEEPSSILKAKEVIIDEAYHVDYWLNQNSYNSIKEIITFDKKLSGFRAVKNKNVYNNNKRSNSTFGNDYWESGVINPHIILKDLIEIFHPNLLEHELYYYQQLE